jgi:hypothetical protein
MKDNKNLSKKTETEMLAEALGTLSRIASNPKGQLNDRVAALHTFQSITRQMAEPKDKDQVTPENRS